MPLRRLLGLSAAVSGRLRRGLSTAASRPPWAMLHKKLVGSPSRRTSLQLAEPPCVSHLVVPAHLLEPPPGGGVQAASGDGLLLLTFANEGSMAPIFFKHGSIHNLADICLDFDVTRFVCNPLSGQTFRLPDIDGTKKTFMFGSGLGILTQSDRPHQPPDRYAVATLLADHGDGGRSFVMRRFFSQTGEWHKPDRLPSPLPHARRIIFMDHEVVAFAGRLWWVDVSWGALSADPFSDRPDLRFVELPRGSVTKPTEGRRRVLARYRRMGVSEGRLRYAEVSKEEPFVLSSFALDDDGSSWTLEHRVALSRLWAQGVHPSQEDTPRIGAVDPLNASVVHLTIGNIALAVDMGQEKVLGCSTIEGDCGIWSCGFLYPSLLPPWLESSHIPSAGTLSTNEASCKGNTLSEILVRADRDTKN
ncbi:hypothetical protein ACP70R_035524 [Stipagrostis hirtigluma subsp. patula]